MPCYTYQAKRKQSALLTGKIDAPTASDAMAALERDGLFTIELVLEKAEPKPVHLFRQRVRPKDISQWTRQLADLLQAHVQLSRAFELLKQQELRPVLRGVTEAIGKAVQEGRSFSEALTAHPQLFSPLYVHSVRAGEASGLLGPVMERLAEFIEGQEEFHSRLLMALAYPGFVGGIGLLTILFLMVFAVPRLSGMFAETGQGMPWLARALDLASRELRSTHALIAMAIFVACVLWGVQHMPNSLRELYRRMVLNIPVWGPALRKGIQARFAKTLGLLLSGGVPILPALDRVAAIVQHPEYQKATERMRMQVEGGHSLADSLRESGLFPSFFCQRIAVGEETHTLEEALAQMATVYERETDRAMKLATSLMEPVMIVGVGIVIGVIVLGMLLPILQISTFVR